MAQLVACWLNCLLDPEFDPQVPILLHIFFSLHIQARQHPMSLPYALSIQPFHPSTLQIQGLSLRVHHRHESSACMGLEKSNGPSAFWPRKLQTTLLPFAIYLRPIPILFLFPFIYLICLNYFLTKLISFFHKKS